MGISICWYSVDQKLRIQEHEAVDLQRAMQIVDDYFAAADERFDYGEDAIAATMFGFSHSKTDFIEICINGSTQISYRFEMADPNAPWLRRLFNGVFQHEEMLESRKALVKKVEEFFTTPVGEIKKRLNKRVLW